ncbi:MAG: dihydrolipoamide acetyltransferase family protein [Nitrospiraceae bacterium]
MADFVMPTLGADMTQGILIEWKKEVGDHVSKGDIIAEVDTEKAAIEIESFSTGVIERLLVKPGDTVPVGAVMAVIRTDSEPVPVLSAAPPSAGPIPSRSTPNLGFRPSHAGPVTAPVEGDTTRLRISPAAKKRAIELGLALSALHGTGPGGAITLEDVQRFGSATTPARSSEQGFDRQTRMRQTIAAAMARSKREIPHYYLSTAIDMSASMAWLSEENRRRAVTDRLLYGVLLIKAVALALRQVPELNALWKGGAAVQCPDVHIGVAISLRSGGLIAPALHRADQLSLGDLMTAFQDLVKRARAGTLRSSELSDSTITVTSLGDQGVETVFGVIYPPQVALVGFGKIVDRPWAVGGQVTARPVVTASLSADHRVTDGHRGGLFLTAVDRYLQEPAKL